MPVTLDFGGLAGSTFRSLRLRTSDRLIAPLDCQLNSIVAYCRQRQPFRFCSYILSLTTLMPIPPAVSSPANSPIARMETVSRLFGSFAALRQITVSFAPGQCYVLLGENGAGKSTLLRILAGLLEPSAGSVSVFEGLAPRNARQRIGYMSHAPMLYDELTALENLQYFRSLYTSPHCLAPAEALRQVGLDPALTRTIGQYSQGMRQRASLARVLLSQPELLLLDEPFSNMDVESVRQMIDLLAGFRSSRRTILLTTHQRELAAPIADQVLTLRTGRLDSLEIGTPHR